MEHDSSEDYYDYDESEHVLADENSSNEIDSGTKKKYLQKRKTDEAVEVPDYIVNFFIEQKILREQREKERRCKEEQTYYTRTPPPNSDINLVLHTRTKYPSKIDYNIFDLKTNTDTSNDELHEESEDYDGEPDYEEEGSEGDFVPESQDHITSIAATTITTAQPEEPRPRWNSIKNVLSNVSNYKRPQKVDRYISKQPGEKHRSRRSTSKKEKTHRKPFRDILYKIIPKQYAKRYIAPKYFPKTFRVTSKVYPVLTKEILRNELHDPAKGKTAHLHEDSSTMSQVGLEDVFNHDIRRNRRNERPIDVVGSFEQVW
ncbi:unnamed protein product [Acanthoscelides obtectus]|nr:unnamed protein product [Acanthoscelides obtectus]CAK1662001.1 hypothetical protein AOBTE_LOCUS22927 [Acanthoscelides obtectus]